MRYPRAKRLPQGRGQLRDTLHISRDPPRRPTGPCLAIGKATWSSAGGPARSGPWWSAIAATCCCSPSLTGFTAERMRPALTAAILRLPQQLRRSLTWDHGREMAEHAQFTVDSGV